MGRRLVRELLVLALPCLALLGAGYHFTARQETQKPVVRRDDNSGPWRAVYDGYEILPVTPAEAWRGYDFKVRIKTHMAGGKNLDPRTLGGARRSIHGDLRLNWTTAGRTHSIPTTATRFNSSNVAFPEVAGALFQYYGTESPPARRGENLPLEYLVNLESLPPADSIELAGGCHYKLESGIDPRKHNPKTGVHWSWKFPEWTLQSDTALIRINLDLKQIRSTLSPPNHQTPKVTKVLLGQFSERYFKLQPVYDRRNGETFIGFTIDSSDFGNINVPALDYFDIHLEDGVGRRVQYKPATFEKKYGYHSLLPNGPSYMTDNKTELHAHANFCLLGLPWDTRGLYYVGWISLNKSWPTKVKLQLRKDGPRQVPRALRLISATQSGDVVTVNLRYPGPKQLVAYGKDRTGRKLYLYGPDYWPPQPEWPPVEGISPAAGRLIADWSQRVEYSADNPHFRPGADLINADCDATGNCTARYRVAFVPPNSSEQGPLFFRAEIGLGEEGFLPVSLPLKMP